LVVIFFRAEELSRKQSATSLANQEKAMLKTRESIVVGGESPVTRWHVDPEMSDHERECYAQAVLIFMFIVVILVSMVLVSFLGENAVGRIQTMSCVAIGTNHPVFIIQKEA
jgi:hypothetical protein